MKKEGTMLSYKFKHLCSRVIASLSAFGLISISNESGAKTLSGSFTDAQPGDSFKYTKIGEMTMTASMKNACSINGSSTAGPTVQTNIRFEVENSSGESVYGCLVTCKDGYFVKGTKGKKSAVYSGISPDESFQMDVIDTTANPFCLPVSSCSKGTSSTIKSVDTKMVKNVETGMRGEVFVDYLAECTWTCADGYSVRGGTDTEATFAYTGATGITGVMTPDQTCLARTFNIYFDCGDGAIYGTSSSQSGMVQATYDSTFTIPTSATCSRAGYSFKGWNGSTN